MNTIIPITVDNLDAVAAAGVKFGMPRSVGWLKRCFFDPTVEDLIQDTIRGHMSVDENGDVKAIQGYYYQPCYLRQTRLLAGTGAIMGAEAKYGEELLCVLDRNKETRTENRLRFGNCISGKRSEKVSKVVNKMRESPYRPFDLRICVPDWSAFLFTALWRMHVRSRYVEFWVYRLLRPVFWLKFFVLRCFGRKYGYMTVSHPSFDDPRFGDFWERFLAANDGIISSREPKRLQWLFNDSIKAGKVFLATAEKDGRIDGFVLLRERCGFESPPRLFDVIDICAVGNATSCLRALCRCATEIAGRNGGVKLFFSGGMPKQEEWLDRYFPFKVAMGNAQFMYRANDPEIEESLAQNKGWFFGPFDGERCLGHGGYVDL